MGVIKLLDSGEIDVQFGNELLKCPFLVTEYIKNGDLKSNFLKSKEFYRDKYSKEGEVKTFLSQMLKIVKVVHVNKIVHRDIKPQNILMQTNFDPVLIDFGIAFDGNNQDLTSVGESIGPMGFCVVPELNIGSEIDDKRSKCCDVVLIIAVAFWMHYHEKLEQLEIPKILLGESFERVYAFAPIKDEVLNYVFTKGLQYDESLRFETCDEVLNVLKNDEIRLDLGVVESSQWKAERDWMRGLGDRLVTKFGTDYHLTKPGNWSTTSESHGCLERQLKFLFKCKEDLEEKKITLILKVLERDQSIPDKTKKDGVKSVRSQSWYVNGKPLYTFTMDQQKVFLIAIEKIVQCAVKSDMDKSQLEKNILVKEVNTTKTIIKKGTNKLNTTI